MTAKPHPFDQITRSEIEKAGRIIRENRNNFYPPYNSQGEYFVWDFNSMINLEPPKKVLLPLLRSGGDLSKLPRKTLVVVEEKGTTNAVQIIVNQDEGTIEKFITAPGKKASFTYDDNAVALKVAVSDPQVIYLLREKYKITDTSRVHGSAWPFGYNGEGPDDAPYNDSKMNFVYLYFWVDEVDDNVWAHPIGFVPLVDLTNKVVRRIIDLPTQSGFTVDPNTNFEIPKKKDNYMRKFIRDDYYRTDIKPILITQPEGPSFTVKNDYEISWQKWNFRISFNYRTGLTFHYITYTAYDKVPGKDGDEERGKDYKGEFIRSKHEVLYQAGLSEMVVPYGDPRSPYHRKMAFDLGEFGMGLAVNSLELGCDCIGSVHYFDFHYSDRDGKPITVKKAVCLHEEDAGLSHKHSDLRTGKVHLVRARRLVLSFISTLGNYDYLFYWYFYQDGTIAHEAKASGELSNNLLANGATPGGWGTNVFPNLNAMHHQHIYNMRLDFIVDGTNNTAAMLDVVPIEGELGSKENPYATGFTLRKTEFKKAKEAVTDTDLKLSRVWIVQNDKKINEYSKTPMAWKIIPSNGAFSGMLAGETSYIRKRAAFAKHAFWVTPFKDDELYAAGFYINQSKGDDGLESWANRNENIKDTDIVVWHTFGITHLPRVEDFPIMPIESCGFMIKPYNLLYQNPALDVPPPKNCSMSSQSYRECCHDCMWGERRALSTITCKHKDELVALRNKQ